ncbi:MAG: hypothetical protein F6K25_19235 [Okeania sp. SIO2G4]|uniref:hypothetical protein n=1 Tax=unclassified Okeania TaxID=2634635 RepID=UPI0013BA95B2|nr:MULTISPECIES: hypothetical protein [unclassified Okeania]NEP03987.1 hypothetical protein [Okeania sp. SIO4D6]NEP40067.1 hypothetical protein [Okeania sp. SIO2H7]NEP74244.1 hypothetical protein [Okeania sp. SIO2G5]NEP95813.1 hypothetical protein [Okeania sp. SIO2F5]NEQ92689.1 hypothetical protein [Okeania sp. SIO2G4]
MKIYHNDRSKITMPINPKQGVKMALTTTGKFIIGLTTTFALTICKPTININICLGCTLDSDNNSISENQVGEIIDEIDENYSVINKSDRLLQLNRTYIKSNFSLISHNKLAIFSHL